MKRLPDRDDELRRALELAGFEPDSNICRCLHRGGRHTLANVCLDCGDYFTSMTKDQVWTHAIAVLRRALAAATNPELAAVYVAVEEADSND